MKTYTYICRLTNALEFSVDAESEEAAYGFLKAHLHIVEAVHGFKLPALHTWQLLSTS